ncbi:uncharacterized protein [Eurosta solidaginis]|uniref:uncharacterized protein n=1 Tax=Eurosta solidaginis TaxID=178769 RepID=UPI0035316834
MDVILPYNTKNREHFCDCALKCGFHEFVVLKLLYTMKDSDLDVFPMMARERLDLILYGWESCQVHWDELKTKQTTSTIPPHLCTVLKQITQYSLDLWFSNEWEDCKPKYKAMLMICLKRAIELLMTLADDTVFDWGYTLHLGTKPWDIPYLQKFVKCNSNLAKKFKQSSEQLEAPATAEDIEHLKKEGLLLMLLRLIKLFDAGYIEGVRRLSMRVIAAWNHEYEQCKLLTNVSYPEINRQHQQCLILICHIYLMAIYEMDDIRGFVIDNMLTNIRFYYENMSDEVSIKPNRAELEYTPARYIAITCINLQISSNEFIDAFIYDSFDENFVSLFGVISQSYLSYLLGNLLMEMNKLNEDDFQKYSENFKRIIHLYIKERERSEEFMLRELHKKELKRRSHTVSATKENMTNFYNKMCKGNRLSNIGSTEHTEEDDEKKSVALEDENERRVDPVFQHLPYNEDVLNYVYTVLVKRTHRGWYFAKLIVLLKIIGLQLNAIETWRYHPGLTPEFLLNLEVKLSRHFEDLATIFQEHLFMEQEFWLTGFYLNPCKKYYETVIRSGMRSNRLSHRFETGENYDDDDRFDNRRDRRGTRDRSGVDKHERVNAINAKYGLLSSTIDVKEIVKLANHESPDIDYGQLYKALRSFKLPDNTIKDLLTVIFLPRNKSFAWALNWVELRKRCKSLLRDNEQKRHFVELNMAEANDRLKFLKVDYEKYKHRPQLDYGSIEQGYESNNMHNFNKDSSDENDDEDSEDFEADSDLDEPAKHEPKKNDHSKLFDSYFMSTRRTRARAAAMIADVLERDAIELKGEKVEVDAEVKKSNDATENSKKQEDSAEKDATQDTKLDFNAMIQERKVFDNRTCGFNPFPDIWSVKEEDLKIVEDKVPHLETGILFEKSAKLEFLKLQNAKLLNQQNLKYKIAQEVIMQDVEIEAAEEEEKEKDIEEDYIDAPKDAQQPHLQSTEESDRAKHDSITDVDMPDDESDVSTTARRDSDEVNDISKEEQLDQGDELLRERFSIPEKVFESPVKSKEKSQTDTEINMPEITQIKIEENLSDKEMDANENEKEAERRESEMEAETNDNENKKQPLEIEREVESKENGQKTEDNKKELESEENDNDKEADRNETKETESADNEIETKESKPETEKEVELGNEKDTEATQIEKPTNSKETEMNPQTKYNENVAESIEIEIEAKTNETETTTNDNETEITANELTENKLSAAEYNDILKRFTRRKLCVKVRRLQVNDVQTLRQPSVRLERLDLPSVGNRLGTLRRAERKFYTDLDDSSKSSVGSSSNDRPLQETVKRRLYCSESSTESDELKKKRRICRPTRGRGMQRNIASNAPSRIDHEPVKISSNLKMTPRSASGLKFRISTNDKTKRVYGDGASTSYTAAVAPHSNAKNLPVIDYIQISSSSSSDEGEVFVIQNVNKKKENIINIAIDPLFEEEIPVFRINK